MTKTIDSNKLIEHLILEMKESGDATKQAWGEFLYHKEQTSNLSAFICNNRLILDDLVKVAEEGQKVKMLGHVVTLIESGKFDITGSGL